MAAEPQAAPAAVDAIVIGAGFSGLAAALRLTLFGKRVLVLESHTIPGGLNSYYYRAPGKRLFNAGLHTFTNYRRTHPKWGRHFLFRSLGIEDDELKLFPPRLPALVQTPSTRLEIANGYADLRAQISAGRNIPAAAWERFEAEIQRGSMAARDETVTDAAVLEEIFRDREVVDLLRLPVFLYAGYREWTVPWAIFAGIFRSLWMDGYCSPQNIKSFLDVILEHLRRQGGQVRYRAGVKRIVTEGGAVRGVELENGESITARAVISSAGRRETQRLVGPDTAVSTGSSVAGAGHRAEQVVSAFETVLEFDGDTAAEGATHSLAFASFREPFAWDHATLSVGVPFVTVSVSDAYTAPEGTLPHHVKIGAYVAGAPWLELTPDAYAAAKAAKEAEMIGTLRAVFPGLKPERARLVESLTPATVVHYTRHLGGAIYGDTEKNFTGVTETRGLFLCGNDHGGIGIVGAAISGVVMANVVLLERQA